MKAEASVCNTSPGMPIRAAQNYLQENKEKTGTCILLFDNKYGANNDHFVATIVLV